MATTNTRIRLAYRHYLRHPWQFFLSVLGIGLGVAVVLAIDLTNASAKRGFDLANQAIAGTITHQIYGTQKTINETVYRDLRVLHGFTEIAPVVTGKVIVRDKEGNRRKFQLLGVDPLAFTGTYATKRLNAVAPQLPSTTTPLITQPGQLLTQPNAVIVLQSAASALGITVPAKIEVWAGTTPQSLQVIDIVEDPDTPQAQALRATLIADISTAQDILRLTGRLSRIDATLNAARAAELQSKLPKPLVLEKFGMRGNAMQQMTRAFHINLTALSLLALLIGAFLIYNSITLSILQRFDLIATARTLGLNRYELIGMVIMEALALGLCGTLLGTALGIGLSQVLLGLVATTINDLYFATEVQAMAYTPKIFIKTATLGMGATVLAAIVPAREASRIAPVMAQSRSRLETANRNRSPWLFIAALLFAAASVATFVFSGRSIVAGFGGLFLIVVAFALMTPALLVVLINAAKPAMYKILGLVGTIAARGVLASLSRTQVAVAALAIALSATVGVALMIGSFRAAVEGWLESYVSADIYITRPRDARHEGIEQATIDRISALPQVVNVSSFRRHEFWRGEQLTQMYVKSLPEQAFDR
ncbi:MAG: ABC transporter permease, partial [Pseudomonadales bacterium]